MFKRILMNIHQVLGLLLCTLFLMWFLSGFVMIFHRFPKVSSQDRIIMQEVIVGELCDIEDLNKLLPDTTKFTGLSVEMHFENPIFNLRSKDFPKMLRADLLSVPDQVTLADIQAMAQRINAALILSVDTLYESDQWLIPRRITADNPVLKYCFDDPQKHELYVSIAQGDVLQYTNKEQRFWAWLGAIPHWVYFTSLRQNHSLWMDFVIWTSGIGVIMCLLGLLIGLRIFWRSRKQGFKTPYKKWWYKWHYLSGLIFGFFALTFAFSGLISMTILPAWLVKKPKAEQVILNNGGYGRNTSLDLSIYLLDYRLLNQKIPNIKKIEWGSYLDKPLYKVYTDDKTLHIDASDSLSVRPFEVSQEMVNQALEAQLGGHSNYTLDVIDQEDDYYFSRKKSRLSFPVYRLTLEDELHTRYYYNPQTLSIQRIDDNIRLRGFLYKGLHSLHFKFLTDRPWLWNVAMFTIMIGGTFLSLSGVVLSLKWIRRKFIKHTNRYKNK